MNCFNSDPASDSAALKNKEIDERLALFKPLFKATHRLLLLGLLAAIQCVQPIPSIQINTVLPVASDYNI